LHGPWNAGAGRIEHRNVEVIGGGNIIQDAKIIVVWLRPISEPGESGRFGAGAERRGCEAAMGEMPDIVRLSADSIAASQTPFRMQFI